MPRIRHSLTPLDIKVDALEDLPQAVVAYGRDLPGGTVLPFHRHRRAHFVYGSSGVMTVTTTSAAYVVPPQRAVWMPAGVMHRIDARSDVATRSLYIETSEATDLPTEVCVLQVAPLLRELVIAAVGAGTEYKPDSPQSRLMAVILDQIRVQPVAALALPMPTDPRLGKIVQSLITNPADPRVTSATGPERSARANEPSRGCSLPRPVCRSARGDSSVDCFVHWNSWPRAIV